MTEYPEVWLYTDGASRGNPGPAALAYRIIDAVGGELDQHAEVVGHATNNEAEYRALIAGLTAARRLTRKIVRCVSDSEVVVKQLNGLYKVKAANLRPLLERVRRLQEEFERVTFEHRLRTDPRIAWVDRLARELLDRRSWP